MKNQNVPILEELVLKRYQLSIMQGYSSFSDMTLSGLMAKDTNTVQNFENDLISKLMKKYTEET